MNVQQMREQIEREKAALGEQPPSLTERMRAAIAVEEIRIDQHDEGARIAAEAQARREAAEQARRERGQRERVLVEKRKLAAVPQEAPEL